MMQVLFLGLAGLICAALWLVLLVATSFNVVTISGGLLVGLYLTGRGREDARRAH